MLGFGQVRCWACNKKVKKKHIFTTVITTSDGDLDLKLCPPCANHLDDILKEIEEVKNRENGIG